jgi:hypothetical protein
VAFRLELMIVRLLMSLVAIIKSFITCLPSITNNSKYSYLCLLASFLANKSFLDLVPTLFLTKIVGREP